MTLMESENLSDAARLEAEQETKSEVEQKAKLEAEQEARAFLRERFLRVIAGCTGKACDIHMFQDTNVSGTFRGVDLNLSSVLVSDMKTHIGTVPQARLRAHDVIWLHFPDLTSETKSNQ